MTALEASCCRFRSKQFHYCSAYKRHLAQEDLSAVWPSSAGRGPTTITRNQGTGARTNESDYEEVFEESCSLSSCPGYGLRHSGTTSPIGWPWRTLLRIPPLRTTGKPEGPFMTPLRSQRKKTRLLSDPWYPFSGVFEFNYARWMNESNLAKASIDL